jgi:hypothetical protein
MALEGTGLEEIARVLEEIVPSGVDAVSDAAMLLTLDGAAMLETGVILAGAAGHNVFL